MLLHHQDLIDLHIPGLPTSKGLLKLMKENMPSRKSFEKLEKISPKTISMLNSDQELSEKIEILNIDNELVEWSSNIIPVTNSM